MNFLSCSWCKFYSRTILILIVIMGQCMSREMWENGFLCSELTGAVAVVQIGGAWVVRAAHHGSKKYVWPMGAVCVCMSKYFILSYVLCSVGSSNMPVCYHMGAVKSSPPLCQALSSFCGAFPLLSLSLF